MKKFLTLMIASAFALTAFVSCSDDEEPVYDDAYFASQATITSSDASFTANSNGGTINFKATGGTVTISVSCGTEWLAENSNPSLFTVTTTTTSLTVTAEQNTVEQEMSGTISLMTAEKRVGFATITIVQNAYGAPEISVSANEWNAPAVGALTTEIAVDASDDWTAEADEEWLTVEKTTDGVILTVIENEETEARTSTVTLTCTDGIKTTNAYIAVSQDGAVYLNISTESLSFDVDGSAETVTVESNFDWDYSSGSSDWLTFSRDGDVLTVTAAANETGEDRDETITFTAGDGAENVAEVLLTATQAGSNAMVLTYTITAANTSTKLPLYGTVDCIVDWGDGSELETVTEDNPSHTYAEAGEYDITIDGTVTALYSKDISSSSKALPITAVKDWGKTGLVDMQYAFYYCKNLVSLPKNTKGAMSNVTSFYDTFYYCSSLEEIPADLFEGCSVATSLYHVFYYCIALKEIPKGLFKDCVEVSEFTGVFRSCNSITAIPADLFSTCSKATDFKYAFYNCYAITEIPAGLFDNCPEVEGFYAAFYKTTISSIPEGLFDNCPKVTTFHQLCYQCSNLTTVPETLFAKCPEVTDFEYVFYQCTSLSSNLAGIFSNNKKVTDFRYAFGDDAALTGESPYDMIDGNKVHLYERDNYPDIYASPKGSTCFRSCTGLTDYSSIPSSWGGGGN